MPLAPPTVAWGPGAAQNLTVDKPLHEPAPNGDILICSVPYEMTLLTCLPNSDSLAALKRAVAQLAEQGACSVEELVRIQPARL